MGVRLLVNRVRDLHRTRIQEENPNPLVEHSSSYLSTHLSRVNF